MLFDFQMKQLFFVVEIFFNENQPRRGTVSYTHLDVYKRQVSKSLQQIASNSGTSHQQATNWKTVNYIVKTNLPHTQRTQWKWNPLTLTTLEALYLNNILKVSYDWQSSERLKKFRKYNIPICRMCLVQQKCFSNKQCHSW